MKQLIHIYKLLKKDLDSVKATISSALLDGSTKDAQPVVEYLLKHQGKQIRPVMVFLSAYLLKSSLTDLEHKQLIQAAAVIELIHLASLVHDDVIDEANFRRGVKSVKSKFGNQVAVTMGVYLYSVALKLVSEIGSIPLLEELSVTVKSMCEGELLQYSLKLSQQFTEENYYSVLRSKTAVLFKTACLMGPLLFNANNQQKLDLSQFALELGYAYQLTDDYLDVFGTKQDLAKTVGQDFFQGQLTLPMIYAVESMSAEDKHLFWDYFEKHDFKGLSLMQEYLKSQMIQEQLRTVIATRISKSKQSLSSFKDSEYKSSLLFLSDYVAQRMR